MTTVIRQFGLYLGWQFRRASQIVPLLIVVQVVLAVATVIGYGFLIGDAPAPVSLYLATGASTVSLVSVGLIMTPQTVARQRSEGSFDWVRTLPLPRGVLLAADLALWTALALPGMILGLVTGSVRFQVDLAPAPWLPLVALAVAATAACVGYALACLLHPMAAVMISQVLLFSVLLFSPVSYPAQRLPDWLRQIHHWLPVEAMADLMRSGLLRHDFPVQPRDVAVLALWCLAGAAAAVWALRRRV
ncbi:MAG: ABC transporter permease [Propionibacteriaceae bacterium]|jgi:ABC-2 type transport system permease protein|nr:ABC transporter permease [Propionibacteriaceae bacterium]